MYAISDLKSKTKAKSFASELSSVSELMSLREVLVNALDNRLNELKAIEKAEADKKAAIEQAVEQLAKMGIDKRTIAEFIGVSKTDIKYVKDGVSWNGKGRAPKAFHGITKDEMDLYAVKS